MTTGFERRLGGAGGLWTMLTLLEIFLVVSPMAFLVSGASPTSNSKQLLSPSSLASGSLADGLVVGPHVRVAVVKPVFTATAYSSYYSFYTLHSTTPNGTFVTADLSLLNTTVVNTWGWSLAVYQFLTSATAKYHGLVLGKNLQVLTDINVGRGGLSSADGSRKFDIVILGFSEYVTVQEYLAYKQFVASGGTLIIMDATNFLAEVKYYPQTNHLALIRGHSWGFDGRHAWRDIYERWALDTRDWVGSNYCSYGVGKRYSGALLTGNDTITSVLRDSFGPRVFTSYSGHEENCVTNNANTETIASWVQLHPKPNQLVAAYVHHYLGGTVIHIGVMGSDVLSSDQSVQLFLIASIWSAGHRG